MKKHADTIFKIALVIMIIVGFIAFVVFTESEKADRPTTFAKAEYQEYAKDETPILPDMVTHGSDAVSYSYVVDRTTGCVYIIAEAHRRFGITPAMNPDGTVITAEQLGIQY